MQDCNVIAKGSYSQFRFNDFVSVRQYLLIRENGKKYLILKLSNDAKDTVTGLKLAVEQLDGRGACIETSHVEWTDINGLPGAKFVPNEKIPLRESCVEVKIRLTGATYGEYVCDVKSDELVVTYDKKESGDETDYSSNTKGEKSVKQARKYKVPHILAIASVLVLICSLVLTMLQLWQFREKENSFRWKDVRYEFIGDKEKGDPIRVIGYSGVQKNIVIPAEIEGYPVVEVAKEAFFNQNNLHTLEILADVTIGDGAFADCDNLTEVVLTSATKVGKDAFADCINLEYVTANNVAELGDGAFAGCRSLRELYLSNEEEALAVGKDAFKGCNKLDVVVIDQIVEYSESTDFLKDAGNVRTLELKNYNCALYEKNTNKPLASLFGGKLPSKLHTLKIADIDALVPSFCANMKELQSVTLGGFSGSRIPAKAFNGCVKLTDFALTYEEDAKPVNAIGEYAFSETKIPSFDCSAAESIGKYAFAGNTALTDVYMSNNEVLCELGDGAFQNCTSLKSMYISGLVSGIPNYAFENCASLTSLTISDAGSLKSIGESALQGCASLANIIIPKGVTHIGDRAFADCAAALSLDLPRSLIGIGEYAFSGCAELKELAIPFNTTNVGFGAFAGCNSLTTLKTPFIGCSATSNNYLAAIFGAETYMDTYVVPENLKTVTVNGICDVADYAFYGVKSLKYLYLTGEIANIGNYSFADCTNLRELHLGPTVQAIQSTAFLNCYVLFEIWNNTALTIEVGSQNYGGIAQYALAVYGVDETRMDYVKVNDFSCVQTETGWYITDYIGENSDWVLPDVFTNQEDDEVDAYALPAYVFAENRQVKTLKVGRGATVVGQGAFMACPNLESVNAISAKQWARLERNTFSACPAMLTVTLPNAMVYIGDKAFEANQALQEISLPDELTELGERAFYGCQSLKDVTIPQKVETLGESIFEGASSLETVDLSNTLFTNLPTATFYDCVSLTTVNTDGANFEYIGDSAFYNTALTKFVFPSSLQIIGLSAFAYSKLPMVNVEHDLYMISQNAFSHSGVKELTISGDVSLIDEYAFAYAQLQDISISGTVSVVNQMAFASSTVQNVAVLGTITAMGEGLFHGCDQLVSAEFADFSISEIPAYTFYNCTKLEEVSLGEGVETIGVSAFYNTVLKNISLDEGVKAIGENAFYNTALTEVALPSTVESIGNYAFANCYELSTMILSESLTDIDYGAFENCYALLEVYNPSALPIVRGNSDYGYVAMNAIIVHTSLDAERMGTETQDGITYKYAPTEKIACVYECVEAPQVVDLSVVEIDGVTYQDVWIRQYVFSGNATIEEVHTGIVTEIQSGAFYGCSALKKVTLGSSLQSDKVAYDAFAQCENLWEVHTENEEQFKFITQDGYAFGQVAYYALAINKEIAYQSIGNFDFMYLDGLWRMYQYNGEGNETLPDIGADYQIYKHPRLDSAPFNWMASGWFIIPTYVTSLSSGVFGMMSYGQILFYEGTVEEWSDLTQNVGWYSPSVYYYRDCVHNGYFGTSYWTYEDGYPTTLDTELREILTEATCQSSGLREWACDTCNEIIYSEYLEQLPHEPTSKVIEQPTCEEMGLEEWRCGVCGEFLYNTHISALGHTDKSTVVKEPTCEENGLNEWTCEVCGKFLYNEDIPATGHVAFTEKVTQEPTCQEEGLKEWICDECGQSIYAEKLPMVDHSFTEKDGSCKWCKQRPVAEDEFGDIISLGNASYYPFLIDKDGVIYTDWREDYYNYQSELIITAQTEVELCFTLRLEGNNSSSVYVYLNGTTLVSLERAGEESVELILQEGDEISIIYCYSGYGKEGCLYIEEFDVQEYVEPDTESDTDSDTVSNDISIDTELPEDTGSDLSSNQEQGGK